MERFGDAASAGGERAAERWSSQGGCGGEARVPWPVLPSGGTAEGLEPLLWCPSPGPVGAPVPGEQPPAKQPTATRELELMLTRAGKLLAFK